MKKQLLFLSFISLLSTPAFSAGEMESIRNDLNVLKSSVENSNTKLAEAMNTLVVLQQEVNSLRGTSESGNYFFDQQNKTLRDYDQRISAVEDKIGLTMTLLNDIKENRGSDKALAADENQTKEFQKLLDFINAQDFSKAQTGFQGFLQKYPKSNLADQAQYWIGESLYSLGDYKKAIAEFQTVIQRYPKSNKVKASLFKQGQSFLALQMLPEAKAFFEKIVITYPGSTEASRANAKIKEIEKMPATSAPASSTSQPAATATPNQSTMSGGLY